MFAGKVASNIKERIEIEKNVHALIRKELTRRTSEGVEIDAICHDLKISRSAMWRYRKGITILKPRTLKKLMDYLF